jgi:hypothetical protein
MLLMIGPRACANRAEPVDPYTGFVQAVSALPGRAGPNSQRRFSAQAAKRYPTRGSVFT